MHMGGNMTHLNGDSLFLHCTPPCHLPFFLMLLVAFLFLEKFRVSTGKLQGISTFYDKYFFQEISTFLASK